MDINKTLDKTLDTTIKKIQFTIPLLEEPILEPDKNTSKKLCILTNSDKKLFLSDCNILF